MSSEAEFKGCKVEFSCRVRKIEIKNRKNLWGSGGCWTRWLASGTCKFVELGDFFEYTYSIF